MSDLEQVRESVDRIGGKVDTMHGDLRELIGKLDERCPAHRAEVAELREEVKGLGVKVWGVVAGMLAALLGAVLSFFRWRG